MQNGTGDVVQSMAALGLNPPKKRGRHAYHVLDNAALGNQVQADKTATTPEPNGLYTPGEPPFGGPFSGTGFNPGQAAQPAAPSSFIPGDIRPPGTPIGTPGPGPNQGPDPAKRVASMAKHAPAPVDSMSAIPSMVEDRETAQDALGPDPVYLTFEMSVPPPASCQYAIEDQGISGPNFARLSMYNVPATDALRQATNLPLGLLVSPFAGLLSGSAKNEPRLPVQSADFSDPTTGPPPPRCRRCRGYMNPAMQFSQGGSRVVCNLCQFSSPVDPEYYQPTDSYNRRVDWQDRPELKYGTYDMAVSNDYWHQGFQPSPLHQLFVIDVTAESVRKNLINLSTTAIRQALYGGGERGNSFPKGAKVGIVTFDRHLHFYNLSRELEEPQMLVVSDITDAFVPLHDGLFVDPEESRTVIEQLLDQLESIYQDTRIEDSCYGAALTVAHKALERSGGRVSLVLAGAPTWGPGGFITNRNRGDARSDTGDEQYKCSSLFMEELGKKYAKSGIGLNLYAFPNGPLDLANCAHVAYKSGGHTRLYQAFLPERDGPRFIAEFVQTNTGESAHQCLIKVRCSNGLQVVRYLGNMFSDDSESAIDPFVGCMDAHSTFGVVFKHDGKLDTKLDAHFQAAVLYTSSSGQRRVRVINVLASVSEQFKPVLNFVDEDACIGILAREAVAKYGTKTLKEIRIGVSDLLVSVFAGYRRNAGSNLPPSQLLMPVALRGFIIYCLALLKSRPLKDGQTLVDGRIAAARLINSLNPTKLGYFLYPVIVGLHNLRPDDCIYLKREGRGENENENENENEPELSAFRMPVNVRASQKAIEDGGVYFVFDGQQLWLFVQALVNPNLLRDLFGPEASELSAVNPNLNRLPELDTDVSKSARVLVDYFRQLAGLEFLAVQLARQGYDGAEHEVYSRLVEDRMSETYAYTEYVSYVHRSVKQVIENGNSKSTTNHLLNDVIKLSHGGI